MGQLLDLARLTLGLLVAGLLPMSLPYFDKRPVAARSFTMLYAAYAVLPALPGWKGLTLWLIVVSLCLLGQFRSNTASGEPAMQRWVARVRTGRKQLGARLRPVGRARDPLVLAVVLAVAFGMFYGSRIPRVVSDLWREDRFSVIVSGFLLAVFVGNILVARAVKPYFEALTKQEQPGLLHLGAYLGWVERALVFVFIATGQPEAAALAITVKSLVRLPEVQGHSGPGYGQYVIVGTMTSLLVAVSAGIVVRIALGLPAL
ncbi:hypothetical protein [Micromonospora coxensis]|uniref:hypothetical protein n=1 Tax=Micromonospora coxensis TaxID=356852 RepID=UPI003439A54C